jgi:hypothetical protein
MEMTSTFSLLILYSDVRSENLAAKGGPKREFSHIFLAILS